MLKKLSRSALAMVLALALTIQVYAVSGGTGTEQYVNSTELTKGLTYTNTIYKNDTYGREESFSLTLSPNSTVKPIVMACDTIYGGMTMSQCIEYAQSQGYNVVAGVNTDFFNYTKVPMGMVVEKGEYRSSPSGQNAVAFFPDGKVQILEAPTVNIQLKNNGSMTNLTNQGQVVNVETFNKMRTASGGLYLYSSAFSTVSTRTTGEGWFVRFRILSGEMTASGTMELEVVECLETTGAVAIGEEYLVLTANKNSGYGEMFRKFAVGDRVTLETTCSDPALAEAEFVTGCGDILVSEGQVTDSSAWDEELMKKQHPRTVLGIREDGTLVLYVVDGRLSSHSNGVSMTMLANEMLDEGCRYAVNLDGGGSSTLSVRLPGQETSQTVNRPSDGKERSCGAYLLLVTEESTDGRAKELYLQEDGTLILAGSSLELHGLAGDRALKPAALPTDVTMSAARGSITDGRYLAPTTAGKDTVTLRSGSTGADGTGTLHVLTEVSGLSLKDGEGKKLTEITLKPGETLQIVPSVYQFGRNVVSTPEAYTYTLPEELGTVGQTGLFTAGAQGGVTGELKISGGGRRVTVPVKILSVFTDVVGTWAEEYVTRLQGLGIVSGTSETTFTPDGSLRRGDFMLMLYNAAGKPQVSQAADFTDVKAEDYYATAIAWAQQAGIAAGTGDGTFHPQDTLTREQAFAFLYRALNRLGVTFTDGDLGLLSGFTDSETLADYAKTSAATLISLNIVSGADGKLNPKGELTRAQMARMICSALDAQR